jgi:phosphotransferase system enzyme I (PtsI)
MIALQGTGVSSGITSGQIKFFRHAQQDIIQRKITDTKSEIQRYEDATSVAAEQLRALGEKAKKDVGEDAASLFETHEMMLEDLDFVEAITTMIQDQNVNAEYAVHEAGKQFAEMLASMDDAYMQARSADVIDISSRLERILTGVKDNSVDSDMPAIIAADDLSPSETVQMDKKRILGFILSAGNRNSHTAILARTLGIPAIIGLGEELKPEFEGRYATLDGQTGQIVIDPDDAAKAYLKEKQQKESDLRLKYNALTGHPDITKNGKEIKLYANIASPEDIDAVIANDAQGIGLFRSEFFYLESSDFPTEEAQFEVYKSVLLKMNGKRVIIRTLDIGADKKIDYFNLPHEENSALGMRAIRICLSRPDVFKTQLRALYRASAFGNLSIMFPMIASVWEIQEIKRICAAVKKELKHEKINYSDSVELGIMIETPASVMISDLLAKEVDFFSIGTNDLTQYTLAADRQGVPGLERFYDSHHTAIMRMIQMTVENAHKANIWAGICGELAADTKLTKVFLAMGVDELSVTPLSVLPVRYSIVHTDIKKDKEKLLSDVLLTQN